MEVGDLVLSCIIKAFDTCWSPLVCSSLQSLTEDGYPKQCLLPFMRGVQLLQANDLGKRLLIGVANPNTKFNHTGSTLLTSRASSYALGPLAPMLGDFVRSQTKGPVQSNC